MSKSRGARLEEGGGHSLAGIVTEQRAAEFNSNKLRPRILFGSKILFRQHLLASVRKAARPDLSLRPRLFDNDKLLLREKTAPPSSPAPARSPLALCNNRCTTRVPTHTRKERVEGERERGPALGLSLDRLSADASER